MDYIEQIRTKKEILIENIKSYIDPSLIEVVGLESKIWDYREHIKLTYQEGQLGYHGINNKNVFSISMCPIFSSQLPEALKILESALIEAKTTYAEVRLMKVQESFIAAIKYEGPNYKLLESLVPRFRGVSVKTVTDRFDFGHCQISQSYLGKDFHMDLWSFMQNHRTMAEKLYQYVLSSIPTHTQVLADLYCGCGLLSFLASNKPIAYIYGIELNPCSISCAKKNQLGAGSSPIEFIAAPAEHLFKYVKKPIDYVIINPPREGLSELMINKLTFILF
jgi:tRNA/tmRNA/rRNA uracil-C5-methylase (TrmA/RlmC/RlmD family)